MRSLYTFGASTFLTQIINYASSNVDSVALGRHSGSAELGLYNRAFQIFSLPLQLLAAPLTRVALPVLSQITDPAQYQRYIERMQLVLTYTLIGILAFVAGTASPLLHFVLGPQWVPGSVILEILCLGGVFQALGYVYYWVCLSRARMGTLLACEAAGRSVMILLIVLAAPHGSAWVAGAVSCGLFITWLLTTTLGMPRIGIDSGRLIKISATPALVFVTFYVLCKFATTTNILGQLSQPGLLLVLLSGGLVYLSVTCLLRPIRHDLRLIYYTARMAIRR